MAQLPVFETLTRITVTMKPTMVARLDILTMNSRMKHRKALNRSEVIQGMVEAAIQSGVDLSDAGSTPDITNLTREKAFCQPS